MPEITQSTDDYLSLILSLPGYTPETIFSLGLLIAARLVPIISISPVFGSKAIPNLAKLFLILCLVTIFLPGNLLALHKNISYSLEFIGYLFKELFIGYLIGFLSAFPFYIVQSSGSLIDHMRGSSSLQVTDPATQNQTGPLGILYNYVLILAFYALDGPFLLFQAISNSFLILPVTEMIPPTFFVKTIPFWKLIVSLFSKLMQLALQLAAPSLVGILMAEMFLGIANRLSPNVQIVFLGIPLKSWLGVALLLLAWYLVVHQMGNESINWIKSIDRTFQLIPKPTQ